MPLNSQPLLSIPNTSTAERNIVPEDKIIKNESVDNKWGRNLEKVKTGDDIKAPVFEMMDIKSPKVDFSIGKGRSDIREENFNVSTTSIYSAYNQGILSL